MLDKVIHFRTALYLSLFIALFQSVGWGIVDAQSPRVATNIVAICAVPFVFAFGLWVQSIFISVLGVLWLLLWSAGLIWGLVPSSQQYSIPLAMFFALSAALNLLTAGIMLTKGARSEFSNERAHQPKYKTYLRWMLFGAVGATMGIATFIDIVNLASK